MRTLDNIWVALGSVLTTLALAGQVVSIELRFTEPEPRNTKAIESRAKSLESVGVPEESVADSVISWLVLDGYLDAHADVSGDTIGVHAGARFKVTFVVFEGTVDTLHFEGRPFTPDEMEKIAASLTTASRLHGHYWARFRITDVIVIDSSVGLVASIDEGPVVTVNNAEYAGLKHTSDNVVDRYLSMDRGDTVSTELLRETEQSARDIPFVRLQSLPEVRPLPGYSEVDVVYRFSEVRQFRIEGVGGYVPDDPVGLVWQLDLSLNNLFGDGRRVAVRSERRERGRNVLDLVYWQPLFWVGVGGIEGRAFTRDYRDDFYEFGVSVDFTTRLTAGVSSGVAASARRVEPSEFGRSYSAYGIGFTVTRDTRWNKLNPEGGYVLSAGVSYGHRRYSAGSVTGSDSGGIETFNETRSRLRAEYYQRLVGNLLGHLAVRYEGLETSEELPPLAELFLVGGPGSLRGYRTDQFAAQRVALASIEPRWRFSAGYLFVFYDAAYLNYRQEAGAGSVETNELYRDSFGLGLRLLDDDRQVTLSLGWNGEDPVDQPRLAVEIGAGL